jgi:aspartyl-tRNA(Asn)/glutamyl-tRNA(Gln) amidotransferase subunit A
MGAQAIASARVSELWSLSAGELLRGYAARSFTPVEVIDALAVRIESLNPSLGAFTTLCLDRAHDEAAAGRSGPLAGVAFAAKDLFDTAGVRTTYGSRMFLDHVPSADAAAVELLRASGAILIGKTQTHEFAWGITSINAGVGSSVNPWDSSRVPGGSSGGSAVALATGMVPLALASDTGGSVRIPAGFCGVMGLKPTYGRVSTEGVWPLAPTMDHAGYMARTPEDLELAFGTRGREDLRSTPVVVCPDLEIVESTPDRRRVFDEAVGVFERLGARVVERPFPAAALVRGTFATIQQVEAARVHREAGLWPERAGEYGDDVGGRLSRAAELDPAVYVDAARDRETLRFAFGALLADDALLLSPVSAVPPARSDDDAALGEFRSSVMPNTTPHNLAGLPACAVRAGFDDAGLPVGVQIAAAPWRDAAVLGAARAFYEATAEMQARWPEPGRG